MAKKSKDKLDDLVGQSDPQAALDATLLLRSAQPLLKALAEDLLERAKSSPAVTASLTERHADEQAKQRTADPYDVWLRFFVKQVAAAWFLSCVFVRVLEDRGLVDQHRIAGPGALDSQQLFFELAPSLSERDYLLTVFRELSELPAAADLFDVRHNPVWLLTPSADGAKKLLQLFRTPSANEPALRFGQADTRFLGDLYQDLDEDVRERFALLQTPHFVESFILDRTLERAIERFGLDDTTLIDPTCGSGHFLLGAFDRLFEHRQKQEPGLPVREVARRALDAVYGSDINPYAVAIARFRLTLAFLEKAGYAKLAQAPKLPLHLAVADSLLHNAQQKVAGQKDTSGQQLDFGEVDAESKFAYREALYALEDEEATRDVLYRQHAAVVGNPPYITVKDKALRETYRRMYGSAMRTYSMGVPFTERFFQLAKGRGFIGMITANSFMKREFGKGLIEDCLPKLNLDVVINTSGAYIPGHGTPTVLLFGTAETPQNTDVLTVLAKRGEPSTPDDPEQGAVWSSIAEHWSEPGFENDYISIARTARTTLGKHPWSLGGGGAAELKELLEERAEKRLGDLIACIGRSTHTGEDGIFFVPPDAAPRLGIPDDGVVALVKGEQVRDWAIAEDEVSLFPYDLVTAKPRAPRAGRESNYYWTFRTTLRDRQDYGEKIENRGLQWFEHSMFFPARYLQPLSITFAFVATYNHFVLDRGGKVFNRSAPIIKLPESATEDDHLALLAYLNSSTACFWMKQVFSPKGMHNGSESNSTPFLVRFEFDGTKLATLPLPTGLLGEHRETFASLGRAVADLQAARSGLNFSVALHRRTAGLDQACTAIVLEREALRDRAIALQDEIDWFTYGCFDLVGADTSSAPAAKEMEVLHLVPGARPFEAAIAELDEGDVRREWFRWNETTPRPETWGDAPRRLTWEARKAAALATRDLALLENPEAKRRWAQPSGKAAQELESDGKVLRDEGEAWISNHVERAATTLGERIVSYREITESLGQDAQFGEVSAWLGRSDTGTADALHVLAAESIPFLAAHRYTDAGLDKRAAWERTWDLQRREDAGDTIANIPVPPKYDAKDFRDANYFRLRGKLDVPKERFISYPGCESDEDKEPVYGWAGWDHAQQAKALAAMYWQRKTQEAWKAERLTPMLAGLYELLPWLKQWHNEPSEEAGDGLGNYFEGFLDGECAALGVTRDQLKAWRPVGKGKGGGKKVSASAKTVDGDSVDSPPRKPRKKRGADA